MALFKPLGITTTSGDPFLDSVVSMTSSDNTSYTSVTALKNSDVYTAVKIIASDIASNEIQLLKNGRVESNAVIEKFNQKPNHYLTGFAFKFALAVNMLLNGNSFVEIKRTGNAVDSFHIIKNSDMTVKQANDGSLIYEINKKRVPSINILHFKYFTSDGLIGVSPLASLKDELDLQSKGNSTLKNFFNRGVNGNGILKVLKSDLDAQAKKSIREKFEEANSGSENAQRTIILDDTMEYKTLEVNTEILKLVNSTDWSTRQIAKCFGLSTERLGVENDHSSVAQSDLMYLRNTLSHYFKVFTTELASKLLPNESEIDLRFNTEDLMELDPQTMLENTIKAVQSSLMTINEARERLGLNSIGEDGNRMIASLNYTYLDLLEAYQFRNKKEEANIGE